MHGVSRKFIDFIRPSVNPEGKPGHSKFINEFHRSFPNRMENFTRINFETIKDEDGPEEKRRKLNKDKHQVT